jgi:hypothetical protein
MKRAVFAFLIVPFILIPTTVLAAIPEGDPAPDFTLNDIYDVPHSLSDFTGKVVIVTFWTHT